MKYLTKNIRYKALKTITKNGFNVSNIQEMNTEFHNLGLPYYLIENEQDKENVYNSIMERNTISPFCKNNNYYENRLEAKKEKTKLLLYFARGNDKTKVVCGYYDFIKHDYRTILNYVPASLSHKIYYDIRRVADTPEWVFNYYEPEQTSLGDYLGSLGILRELKSCPKNLIPFLKENNLSLNEKSYLEYNIHNFLLTINEQYRKIGKSVLEWGIDEWRIKEFFKNILKENKCTLFKVLCQIVLTTIKDTTYIFKIDNKLCDLIDEICNFDNIKEEKIVKLLDTNRDLEYNANNLCAIRNKELDNKIAKQQKKILHFDNFEISPDLICVIPKHLTDLQDEGKQQNNCVGSFYNGNIIKGSDKIFFIRFKKTPEKSYITCRVNSKGNVVEARYKNNVYATTNDIEKISRFEKKYLIPYYKKHLIK